MITRTGFNFHPSISADGKTTAFAAEAEDGPPRVFTIATDGSNLTPITTQLSERPHLSPDGRTLLYTTGYGNELWLHPLDGGERRRLTDRALGGAVLSPDGTKVAFLEWRASEQAALAHLKIVPSDDGPPLLDIPWSTGLDLRWHPNGRAVTYRRTVGGVTQIFSQPVDGGEASQLTTFQQGTFGSYDWTARGGLVMVWTESSSDVVLISDWRREP